MGHHKKVAADLLRQGAQIGRVGERHNEQVSRVDRADIHEGDRSIIAVEQAGWHLADHDAAEDAGGIMISLRR